MLEYMNPTYNLMKSILLVCLKARVCQNWPLWYIFCAFYRSRTEFRLLSGCGHRLWNNVLRLCVSVPTWLWIRWNQKHLCEHFLGSRWRERLDVMENTDHLASQCRRLVQLFRLRGRTGVPGVDREWWSPWLPLLPALQDDVARQNGTCTVIMLF